jgi:hypothetical protein
MSVLTIARSGLKSQVVRELVGERTLDIFSALNGGGGGDSGILDGILNLGSRLVGFLVQAGVNGLRWLLRNAWEIFVEAFSEFSTFDWNQTDQSVAQAIEQNNIQLASSAGDLAGTGFVWLASLGVAGLVSLKFPVIGGQVALAIAREGGDEIRGALQGFLMQARDIAVRNTVLSGFLTARRMRLFGLAPINDQREPWTIAEAGEDLIQSIPSPLIRAFVENFVDSALEAVIEVGYVVTYAIDDYYGAQRLANNAAFGEQRKVLLTPDNQASEENLVLRGPQTLIQQNVQTALVQHQLIHNRDVGQIVGQPAGDWLRAGVQRRTLTIVFKNKQSPPWTLPNNERIKQVTITIPDCKQGLTWNEIKMAARPWIWGRFKATANLDNGRKLKLNAATEGEAEQQIRRFALLQSAEILTLNISEEKDRHISLVKRPEQMYPSYATLLVRRRVSGDSGLTDLEGQSYRNSVIRFDLWPESEPAGLPVLT